MGEEGGYFEGINSEEIKYDTFTAGKKLSVTVNGEVKTYKADTVCQVNPPKFDCAEDMANLTYLGDACVLWNSVVRYKNELIYTYSGLFCIAINPYKRYPIYTLRTMELYVGKRRNECWPHIFAIAEGAYQGMMQPGNTQSILITGESGAGKTENTKKVISYFATICSSGKRKEGEASLEDKIVQTNPVLEAWGNAKTVRNDNSSRFGKFIRIHFNQSGKLSGADMVVYLLEKSRLTYQQPLERCYHAFYNIMSDQVPDLKEKCFLSNDILDYWFVSQGKLTVPSIDDKEDMQFADEAFDILGFSEDEKYDVFKCTAALMHMGNMTKDFVPVGKEEQAEIKDDINAQKVAALCGIDCEWMITYFCKPKLKVGTEWVQKGSTCSGAASSVSGIARAIYERSFRLVVEKCNETLCDPSMKKVTYIGVLDIAGFEIFDYNGFEQICINYVNEKLQQFFNQHMFSLEQEEYVREGLDWANVDFGMDLQKCIDMFEKPMAFLAIFEEESLFPKATDKTFAEKLMSNMLGKWSQFAKPNPRPDPDAHFAVIHYAATVSYNLTGWLEKNKDPLNDTIVEMIKNGGNALMIRSFADHPGQPTETPKDQDRKKKGGGKTVSSFFKSQLDDLMTTLYKAEPHFIRCVVPNTPVIVSDQVGLSRATTGCVIACLFKEFQISASFEGLIETVPGINASLLKTDNYVMNPEKDTLFRGEFEVVKELLTKLKDGAGAKNNADKIIDLNGTPKTGGTGIKQLRENIAESKLSYEIMDDAAQAFLKTKIMDNIQKYFYLIVFAAYSREAATSARDAVEADQKAEVALPISGKFSIPATQLKLGKTFSTFLSENAGLDALIDTGKGNLQWERDIPPSALANLESLAAKDFKGNLGKIIHDIYQTAHVMFHDMPQGDHKKRAKYRFASKTIMRILPADRKKEIEGLIEAKKMTMDLYEILGKCTWAEVK